MQNMLTTLGDLYFRLHHARWFTIAVLLALAACAYTIAGARPDETRAFYNVSDFTQDANLSTLLNRYVNITGQLDPNNKIEVKTDVIGVQVRGTRFVALNVSGRNESIMVMDQNIPTPDSSGMVNLTGIIRGKPDGAAQYPPYYLEPDQPADITLNNFLARLAITLTALLLLFVLGGWLVRRANYAINSGAAVNLNYSGPLLWFGGLGSRFQNALVRQGAVARTEIPQESRLDALAGQPWSVNIRKMHHMAKASVATAYGTLPALRLSFEDERGLTRQGVVAGSQSEIDATEQKLRMRI